MQTNQAPSTAGEQELEQRITDYLSAGGLFNPEMMEHNKVRDLLIECRAALAAERERHDDLQRSVMDLSHPNCKVLLNERNEAREQLAAERENDYYWKRYIQCSNDFRALRVDYNKLREQLAAKHRELEETTDTLHQQIRNDREQLATERERTARYSMQADDLNGENQQLREQLATKQEQWDTQFTATITILGKTQQQLATAVDLAKGNVTGCGTCHTIAKLARIEEGKSC